MNTCRATEIARQCRRSSWSPRGSAYTTRIANTVTSVDSATMQHKPYPHQLHLVLQAHQGSVKVRARAGRDSGLPRHRCSPALLHHYRRERLVHHKGPKGPTRRSGACLASHSSRVHARKTDARTRMGELPLRRRGEGLQLHRRYSPRQDLGRQRRLLGPKAR